MCNQSNGAYLSRTWIIMNITVIHSARRECSSMSSYSPMCNDPVCNHRHGRSCYVVTITVLQVSVGRSFKIRSLSVKLYLCIHQFILT